MDWLNYHHLHYFWMVAREGRLSKAAEKLRLAQPTVSAQIKQLEASLGERLFERQGRTLILTDTGRLVFRYADEIFGAGRELLETLRGRPTGRPPHLAVGIANAVPKLIVFKLLQPAVTGAGAMHLVCREDSTDRLLAALAAHELDVVLTDTPAPPHVRFKVFNHSLGESETAFFGPARSAARLRRHFPASLDGTPMLAPTANTALRRALEDWLDDNGIRPRIVGEFEDSALMKVFGQSTGIVFPAPAAIAREVCRHYGVRTIGTAPVRDRFFAISAERRVTHPGVLAVTGAARTDLFGSEDAE